MTIVFTGDKGTIISLDCGTDVSSATTAKILVTKPNKDSAEWIAMPNGTSIEYTTKGTDLDTPGTWRLQAYVEMPGWQGRGSVVILDVER